MRQFKLHNANGIMYDLNSSDSFFYDPQGLGFDWKIKYETIGNQYIEQSREMKQKSLSGTISFAGYQEYERFMKFVQFKPLTLEYTAEGTYFLKIDIESIDKTEIQTGGLQSNIKMIALGQIYKRVRERIDTTVKNGKVYPYRYQYTYAENTSGSVTIDCDSVMDSPVTMTILGPCKNPSWVHYCNGIKIATGKVYCKITEGHRLVISTEGQYKIIETDAYNKERTDRYQDSDFATERFITIAHGTNIISFGHEGTNTLNVIVEGMIYYESI